MGWEKTKNASDAFRGDGLFFGRITDLDAPFNDTSKEHPAAWLPSVF